MSASSDLQTAIAAFLGAPGVLSAAVPIVKRRTKRLADEIAAQVANHGLCIWVMPTMPTSAVETEDGSIVFFDRVDVRVRTVEMPALNRFDIDAYDLIEEIALGLTGKIAAGICSVPFSLAKKPFEIVEGHDPATNQMTRVIDVIFNAAYGLVVPGDTPIPGPTMDSTNYDFSQT